MSEQVHNHTTNILKQKEREKKRAAALRINLKRRKSQTRSRIDKKPDEIND
jgi:hypothetical protein